MVSCTYLFVLVSALAVTVFAEDVEKSKSNEVDEKWWNGGLGLGWNGGFRSFNGFSFYNTGYFNTFSYIPRFFSWAPTSLYGCTIISNPRVLWFSKASETPNKEKSRRSSLPTAQHINPRADTTFACENKNGQKAYFQKADCLQAAGNLVDKKLASATQGQCTLSLVSPQGVMEAHNVPKSVIQQAVQDIMASCAKDAKNVPHAKRSPAEISKAQGNEIALVISKTR